MKHLEIADLKRPITPASQASGISEEWKSPSENVNLMAYIGYLS